MKVDTHTMLSAITCDYLAKLWWAKTEDAEKGTNRPVSILSSLLGTDTPKHTEEGFDSVEEFNEARRNLLERGD